MSKGYEPVHGYDGHISARHSHFNKESLALIRMNIFEKFFIEIICSSNHSMAAKPNLLLILLFSIRNELELSKKI